MKLRTEGEDNLETFINYINSIHPTIKFTHEYSNSSHQSLPFLDVQVHLNNREFKHDVYGRRQTAKITSDFLFSSCNSEDLDVSRDEVEGKIEILGKQNSLSPCLFHCLL